MPSRFAQGVPVPLPPASTLERWNRLSEGQPWVCLQLSAHDSLLLVCAQPGMGAAPGGMYLPLGLDLLVQQVFAGKMPNEAQLEHGIMLVEDTIMPLAAQIPAHSVLLLHDPVLREMGRSALGSARATTRSLRREAVETLFNLLAMQAAHPSVPHHDVPQTPQAAAALLILREVLHHWQLPMLYLDQANG